MSAHHLWGTLNNDVANYMPIKTKEDRIKYKVKFEHNYDKYKELYNAYDQIMKRFSPLKKEIEQYQKGSKGYKEVKNEMSREYERTKEDRGEFWNLHEKLAHIKELVRDYDFSNAF